MILDACKRAYGKGLFERDDVPVKCPVELATVEIYLQILKPVYLLSLSFQRTNSTIGDVNPSILKCIDTLERMDVPTVPKQLCTKLVKSIRRYFDHELSSHVFAAAMITKVSSLKYWIGREWAAGYLLKGADALFEVGKQFVFKSRFQTRPRIESTSSAEEEVSPTQVNSSRSGSDLFFQFFGEEDEAVDARHYETQTAQNEFENAFKNEIDQFKKLIRKPSFFNSRELSTRVFWLENSGQFPYLSELALVLLSIPSSSAMIERFFTCCGIISDKFISIEDELFEYRALIRANKHIFDQMNVKKNQN
jgi:hypothetical protein